MEAKRRPRAFPRRHQAVSVKAMVNVDVSPSVILGVGLIGSGVSLWQIRQTKPWISKDYDVVISCISLLVGGILIFQGWRLDPLLLFGQLMTTGAALSFAVEALRLRNEVYEQEERDALGGGYRRNNGNGNYGDDSSNGGNGRWGGGPQQLPPPEGGYYPLPVQEFDYYDGNEEYEEYEEYDDTTYYAEEGDDVRVYETTIGVDEDGEEARDGGEGYGFGSIGYARPYRDLPGEEDDF